MKNSLLSLLICLTFCISTANAKLFDGEEFYLDNGLRVIVIPNHKAPIVKHMIWYKVGAIDDPLGKAGMAHMLEHLMFKGTKKIKDFDKIVTENGGNGNAFTSYDFTSYHQETDISKLELIMFIEADRMKNLLFDDKEFAKERMVVFNERKQVVENNPASEFVESFRHNLWQTHPYSRPVIGTSDEILGYKLKDIKKFYKKYYTPSNATVVISGDIDVETAKTLAQKYYGKIDNSPITNRHNLPAISSNAEYQIKMQLPNIQTPRYVKTYVADNLSYPLMVLSKYLGEGKTSELYKRLVLSKNKLISISTDYSYANRSYGTFTISALPKTDADVSSLIDKEIDDIVKKMTEKDLQKTKDKLLSGLVLLKDNPFEAAYIVGALSNTMSFEDIQNWDENISTVSLKDIKKAYSDLIKSTNQTGILLPGV